MGGPIVMIAISLLFAVTQGIMAFSDVWLSLWSRNTIGLPSLTYLLIFGGIGLVTVVSLLSVDPFVNNRGRISKCQSNTDTPDSYCVDI